MKFLFKIIFIFGNDYLISTLIQFILAEIGGLVWKLTDSKHVSGVLR